jgi:Na+/proline symporter
VFVVPRLCRRPGISLGGFLQVSDRLVDITTGLLSTVVYTLVTAAQIVALIKVVQPFFPVPAPVLALAATLGIAAYVLYGGYASVTVTDVIQFLVMGVCYFGLVGLSLLAGAGGPGAGAPIPPQTMPLDLVLLLATPFLFIPVSQDLHIRVNSAASPGHARLGVAVAAAAYLVFGIVSVSVGRALAQAGIALGVPDDAVPAFLARTFGSFAIVPTVAIVCVVVSTLDSMLFASASSLAYDFWDKAASRSRQKDTARPRVATMIVLGLALAIALQAPRILALVLSALALYVSVLLPMMIGRLLDRRPSHLGRLALALFLFVLGAETALHAAVALGALPVLPPFRAFAYTLVHLLAVAALKREAAP